MSGLSLYSLLASFLIMGIILLAASNAFLDVAGSYNVSVSENTSGFLSSVNDSQGDIMTWTNEKQSAIGENDPDTALSFITTGILFILTSPMSLTMAFINLVYAFNNSMAFALGINAGDLAYITYTLVALITLTFMFAVIRAITGKDP